MYSETLNLANLPEEDLLRWLMNSVDSLSYHTGKMGWSEGDDPPCAEIGMAYTSILDEIAKRTSQLPSLWCEAFDLPEGSTYLDLARKARTLHVDVVFTATTLVAAADAHNRMYLINTK